MEMTLEVVMVVVSMEVDKVVDEVPDMVADRTDWYILPYIEPHMMTVDEKKSKK